jgi:hypothetical protein
MRTGNATRDRERIQMNPADTSHKTPNATYCRRWCAGVFVVTLPRRSSQSVGTG